MGFVVTVHGESEVIHEFAADNSLRRMPGKTGGKLIDRRVGVVEVVIPPRSELIGMNVFPGMVTESGDFVILAVQRQGEDLDRGPAKLMVGDTLLLQGTWDDLDRGRLRTRDLLVVDSPSLVRRQAIALGPRAWLAIAILVAMVVLLATNAVPAVEAALLAAGAMILTRVVTIYQAYRSISWTTVVLVAGMIPLSTAVTQSGAADDIAGLLLDVVGDAGPYALLVGLFVITAVFGQLISQHGHRPDHDPDRGHRGDRCRDLGAPGADVAHRGRRRRLHHAGGDAGEPDGDGPGRLRVRRLLEAGAAACSCCSWRPPCSWSRCSGRSDRAARTRLIGGTEAQPPGSPAWLSLR